MNLKKISDSFRVADQSWYKRIANYLGLDYETNSHHDSVYVDFYGDDDKLQQVANLFENPEKPQDGHYQVEISSFGEPYDFSDVEEKVNEIVDSRSGRKKVKDSKNTDSVIKAVFIKRSDSNLPEAPIKMYFDGEHFKVKFGSGRDSNQNELSADTWDAALKEAKLWLAQNFNIKVEKVSNIELSEVGECSYAEAIKYLEILGGIPA